MIHQIEITFKNNIKDHHGEHLLHDVSEIGITGINDIRSCQLYSFEGNISKDDAEQIAKKLLSDPITEEFRIVDPADEKELGRTGYHSVEVWLKHGVTDTVSESVRKAVKDLGFGQDMGIKTGQKYFFKGKFAVKRLEQLSEKLLVNPIIQTYKII